MSCQRTPWLTLILFAALLVILLGLAFALPTVSAAQPRATVQARATEAAATLNAASGNLQTTLDAAGGIATNAAATARAVVTNAAATLGAASGSIQATVTAAGQNFQVTRAAAATAIAATRTAVSGSVQTRSTEVYATAWAAATQAVAGVEAFATEAVATVQAASTQIVATAQYVSTVVYAGVDTALATATAIFADLEALWAAVPDEVAAMLVYLVEETSASYDPATNTLYATSYVPEQQANDLLDVLLMAGGYTPDAAALDTISGYVKVILTDVSAELSGTAVLTYQLQVSNGDLLAVLVGVTVNNIPVPLDMIPDDLYSLVSIAVEGAALTAAVNLPDPRIYTVVESAEVSEEGILVAYSIPLDQF